MNIKLNMEPPCVSQESQALTSIVLCTPDKLNFPTNPPVEDGFIEFAEYHSQNLQISEQSSMHLENCLNNTRYRLLEPMIVSVDRQEPRQDRISVHEFY